MKLTMLGTGMAMVTACYNTCFVLEEKGESFLVDGGGAAYSQSYSVSYRGYPYQAA